MISSFRKLRDSTAGVRTLRDRLKRGVTAVEFTLLAPVLFLFLIGLVETSLMLLVQHVIENATYNASRLSKTGYIENNRTQLETVMDVVDRELGSLSPLINISRLSFVSKVYGTLTPEGEGDDGLGTAGEIVVFTISYPWKIFTPIMGEIIGDANGIINLSSRIVVKNEPYT